MEGHLAACLASSASSEIGSHTFSQGLLVYYTVSLDHYALYRRPCNGLDLHSFRNIVKAALVSAKF